MFGSVAKTFGRHFLIAQLAPVSVFIGVNVILIFNNILPGLESWKKWEDYKEIVLSIIIFLIALGLRQFSILLVRFYEGYLFDKLIPFGLGVTILGVVLIYINLITTISFFILCSGSSIFLISISQKIILPHHIKQYKKRLKTIIENEKEESPETRKKNLIIESEFVRDYPLSEDVVLPTKLGNTIRAFEFYPFLIYNIDTVTIWPRLMVIVPQSCRDQIEEAESNFQLLLNISFLSLILGIECLSTFFYTYYMSLFTLDTPHINISIISISMISFMISYSFYYASIARANDWGESVKSAFDLYRLDLLKKFGIFLPPKAFNLSQEQEIWGKLQAMTSYARRLSNDVTFLMDTWNPQYIAERSEKIYSYTRSLSEDFSMNENTLILKGISSLFLEEHEKVSKELKDIHKKYNIRPYEGLNLPIKANSSKERDMKHAQELYLKKEKLEYRLNEIKRLLDCD